MNRRLASVRGGFVFIVLLLMGFSAHGARFPEGFSWCASTAAHQIEGGNYNNDWWEWEQTPGRIKNGETSERATGSWELWREDIEALKQLKASRYRFSVEWARIEPREGEFDQAVIARYLEQIRALRENGIEPFVTLHHFTNPIWFARKGGWSWPGAPEAFEKYVNRVAEAFGAEVDSWVTFNEPTVLGLAGYIEGIFPPGRKGDVADLVEPFRHILMAHARVYPILHHFNPRARVGMAHHLRVFEPKSSWNPLDSWAADMADKNINWALPRALESGRFTMYFPGKIDVDEVIEGLAGTHDFMGVNYYTRDLISVNLLSSRIIERSIPEGRPCPIWAGRSMSWRVFIGF
ncbi:MAG: glycoside hydrolase family 1 protein [Calothrix sp. SM1_5_4]|nr:glycoside hydrolase family 1 protein [Calothrix sp. SM1_5_4]